jgi:hypothetical protein
VVAAAYAFVETQPTQQLAQVVEGDVRIRCPAKYAGQNLIILGHDTGLQQLCDRA